MEACGHVPRRPGGLQERSIASQKPPGESQSTLQNTALSIQRTPGTLHDILPLVKSFLTAFRKLCCRPDNSDTLARSTSIRSVVHNQSLSDCTSSLHVTSYRPPLPAWCWGSAMNCDLRSFWEICSTGAAATEFSHALLMQAASPNVHEERNQFVQKMDDTLWLRCCSQLHGSADDACGHDLRCSRQCGCATLACARRLLVLCASGMNPYQAS